MNRNSDSEHGHSNDNPLNPMVTGSIAFLVGAGMSIYFAISGDLGTSSLLILLAFSGVLGFIGWGVTSFLKRAGRAKNPKD